jgi:2-polyprenyl-6-methoxyphenol hydroxylase-like FAD-dependent oxidoreductase
MGKKIIVAGLGHGGIAAAAMLAKRGFDVTVYEKKSEGTLGYDWTDIFAPAALGIAEMPMPDEDKFEYKENMTFFAPTSKRSLTQHVPYDELEIKMDLLGI